MEPLRLENRYKLKFSTFGLTPLWFSAYASSFQHFQPRSVTISIVTFGTLLRPDYRFILAYPRTHWPPAAAPTPYLFADTMVLLKSVRCIRTASRIERTRMNKIPWIRGALRRWRPRRNASTLLCPFPSSSLLVKRPVVRKHAGGILKSDLKRGQAEAAVICS